MMGYIAEATPFAHPAGSSEDEERSTAYMTGLNCNVMKNLIKPDNEAEAIALQTILEQHGIQAKIVSFHDTAYDGLFQHQYGWGVIKVDESDYLQAQRIIQEWKGAVPEKIRWEDDTP